MDFSGLKHVFNEMHEKGLHDAAQMVVRHRGEVIFDEVIGKSRGKPVTPEMPFFTFSCAKAFTAICVLKLVEEGRIDLEARVADYWPEFGQKGKEKATIRQTLLHQAGIPARGMERQTLSWPVWGLVTRNVANLEAEFEPGTQVAYHMVNFGFILGEVLRRVTGIKIEDYFQRAFAEPLGLANTCLRLPWGMLRKTPKIMAIAEDQWQAATVFNLPHIRTASIPAATLHSTAREMAIFYQMLLDGGEYAGRRYLKPETVAMAVEKAYKQYDSLLEALAIRSMAFHLGHNPPEEGRIGPVMGSGSTERTYGHYGQRSCMAWADPDAGLVVTFTCNGLLGQDESRERWMRLSNAVWEGVK